MRPLPFALLLSTLSGVTGCAVVGHLYPVQGPLSLQSPVPIYSLSMTGLLTSGTITVTVQSGEVCKGVWSLVPQDDPTANQMAAEWDNVYGPGFFVANVLGNAVFGRAMLTGNKGSTVNVQFYNPVPGHATAVKGVAMDNKGNIFKLTLSGVGPNSGPAPDPNTKPVGSRPPQEITS